LGVSVNSVQALPFFYKTTGRIQKIKAVFVFELTQNRKHKTVNFTV